ncbi:MAG: hypothetical protein ACQEXX_11480 [Bacillota bacterium]
MINFAYDALSTMQILEVDFDAVLVAIPHKVKQNFEAYSYYFAGTPCILPARGTPPF